MGLFGWSQVTVTRDASADFVLPVPMGSPLNYYGVGDFRTLVTGSVTDTGERAATTAVAPNGWTTPNGAYASGGSTHANNATGASQGYGNFGITVPAGSVIRGIEVRVDARSTDSAGCAIGVSLSANGGTTWTSQKTQSLTGCVRRAPPRGRHRHVGRGLGPGQRDERVAGGARDRRGSGSRLCRQRPDGPRLPDREGLLHRSAHPAEPGDHRARRHGAREPGLLGRDRGPGQQPIDRRCLCHRLQPESHA